MWYLLSIIWWIIGKMISGFYFLVLLELKKKNKLLWFEWIYLGMYQLAFLVVWEDILKYVNSHYYSALYWILEWFFNSSFFQSLG